MLTKTINIKKLNEKIAELKVNKKTILAFDFDELAVPNHLTIQVTDLIAKPRDKKIMSLLKQGSFEEIYYLNSLIYGVSKKEFLTNLKKVMSKTSWTSGFDKMILKLSKKYVIIFISSGIINIIEPKLKEINISKKCIFAGEISFKNQRIDGTKLIISADLKGDIIKKLKKTNRVIAIGHSIGDKPMLDNADVSIAFKSRLTNLAHYNINNIKELEKTIISNS